MTGCCGPRYKVAPRLLHEAGLWMHSSWLICRSDCWMANRSIRRIHTWPAVADISGTEPRCHHPRRQLVFAKGPRQIPDHALVLGKLAFEVERVFPIEFGRHYFRYSRLLPPKNPFQAKLSNHWAGWQRFNLKSRFGPLGDVVGIRGEPESDLSPAVSAIS